MFHEVPWVIKVLAAGGAGDHAGHAAVVQPLGVGLALAGEPQLAVVALVCDQACDRVETHSATRKDILFVVQVCRCFVTSTCNCHKSRCLEHCKSLRPLDQFPHP